MTSISFIEPDEQKFEVGYKHMEQISYIDSLDPKNTIDSFKLSVFDFLSRNNKVDKVDLVYNFIDDYLVSFIP